MPSPSLPSSPTSPSQPRPRFSIQCELLVTSRKEDHLVGELNIARDTGAWTGIAARDSSTKDGLPRGSVNGIASGSGDPVVIGQLLKPEKDKARGSFGSRLRRIPSPLADHRKSSSTPSSPIPPSPSSPSTLMPTSATSTSTSSRFRPSLTETLSSTRNNAQDEGSSAPRSAYKHENSSASLPEIRLQPTPESRAGMNDLPRDGLQSLDLGDSGAGSSTTSASTSTPSRMKMGSGTGSISPFGGMFASGSGSKSSSASNSASVAAISGSDSGSMSSRRPVGFGLGGEGRPSSSSLSGSIRRRGDRPRALDLAGGNGPGGDENGNAIASSSSLNPRSLAGVRNRNGGMGKGKGVDRDSGEDAGKESKDGQEWVPIRAEFSDEAGRATLTLRESDESPRNIDLASLQSTSISIPHRSLYLGRHVLLIRDIPLEALDTGYRQPVGMRHDSLPKNMERSGSTGSTNRSETGTGNLPSPDPRSSKSISPGLQSPADTLSPPRSPRARAIPPSSGGRPIISPRTSSVASSPASSLAGGLSGSASGSIIEGLTGPGLKGMDLPRPAYSPISDNGVSPVNATHDRSIGRGEAREVVLAFSDAKARDGWSALLRSFTRLEVKYAADNDMPAPRVSLNRMTSEEAMRSSRRSDVAGAGGRQRSVERRSVSTENPERRKDRVYRRLELTILDAGKLVMPKRLEDLDPISPTPASTFTFMKSISMGFDDLISRDSSRGKETKDIQMDRSGSASPPEIYVEVYVDGRLMARTSKKTDNINPLWSEETFLEDLPPSEQCTVDVVQVDAVDGPIVIGSVDLRLADFDLGSIFEKRHILRSEIGDITGEIRLRLRREELSIGRVKQYSELQKSLFTSRAVVTQAADDELAFVTALPGCPVSICRIAATNGRLQHFLFALIDAEPPGPAATLFRSNSPLTRVLETTMRIMAADFVNVAVGSIVREICQKQVEFTTFSASSFEAAPRLTREREVVELYGYVSRLWRCIFDSRDAFPSFLRTVLDRLVRSVARFHAEVNVHDHAVASFVFLRLLSPSIMWPHLYGIVAETPSASNLKALQVVAKPLMNLAFSVEYKDSQDSYLRFFKPFGTENAGLMSGFLQTCSTACPSWEQKDPAALELSHYLTGRKSALPGLEAEAIPSLTPLGWVDAGRELASVKHRKVLGSIRPRASFESDHTRRLPYLSERPSLDSTASEESRPPIRPVRKLEARSASTADTRRQARMGSIDMNEETGTAESTAFDIISMADLLKTPPPPPYEPISPPTKLPTRISRTKSILTSLRSPSSTAVNTSGRKTSINSGMSTRSSVDSDSPTSPHPSLSLGRPV